MCALQKGISQVATLYWQESLSSVTWQAGIHRFVQEPVIFSATESQWDGLPRSLWCWCILFSFPWPRLHVSTTSVADCACVLWSAFPLEAAEGRDLLHLMGMQSLLSSGCSWKPGSGSSHFDSGTVWWFVSCAWQPSSAACPPLGEVTPLWWVIHPHLQAVPKLSGVSSPLRSSQLSRDWTSPPPLVSELSISAQTAYIFF